MSEIVVLERISTNGRWSSLYLNLPMDGVGVKINNIPDANEDTALSKLLDDFENKFKFVNLRSKILQGFLQLRENDLSGDSHETMEIDVVTENLVLKRSSRSYDNYVCLDIKMYDGDRLLDSMSTYATNNNENEAAMELFDGIVEPHYSDYLTIESLRKLEFKVRQGFNQLRVSDFSGYNNDIEIHVVTKDQPEDIPEYQPEDQPEYQPEEQPEDQPEDQPEEQPEDQPESHLSCKKNANEYIVPRLISNIFTYIIQYIYHSSKSSAENEISQSEVQQKLAIVENDMKFFVRFYEAMKFFEDNKCSVCLSNYKEILDDDLHIVIPYCGHPLCCKCADNILKSEKNECPRCKENVTATSFNLMKFNADLQMVTQYQRVFL